MTYTYIQSEPTLWTVGERDATGRWRPESDHGSPEEAAARVRWLNGGPEPLARNEAHVVDQLDALEARQLSRWADQLETVASNGPGWERGHIETIAADFEQAGKPVLAAMVLALLADRDLEFGWRQHWQDRGERLTRALNAARVEISDLQHTLVQEADERERAAFLLHSVRAELSRLKGGAA